MKVQGIEVTEAQVNAMLATMNSRFRASEVEAAAEKAGVASEISMRATDRLLQQQRQKGHIKQIPEDAPYWSKL
jgi:hypothetical protein